MADVKPETAFDLEQLFLDINRSFLEAALELRKSFSEPAWADSPFVYHMPKMRLSIRLVLSYSGGSIKGIFSKEKAEQTQELTSTLDVDIVAVPRIGQATIAGGIAAPAVSDRRE